MSLMAKFRFKIRWWIWFLGGPNRFRFTGPNASENWKIAMERWDEKEPKP